MVWKQLAELAYWYTCTNIKNLHTDAYIFYIKFNLCLYIYKTLVITVIFNVPELPPAAPPHAPTVYTYFPLYTLGQVI